MGNEKGRVEMKMRITNKKTASWLGLLVGASLIFGCETPDWEAPAYISGQLTDGDATQQRIALEHLGRLTDEKQRECVPALANVYKDAGPNQKDAMAILVQLRDKASTEAYLSELKTNTTGFAAASAEALGEIGAKEAIPDMLELLKSTDSTETKIGIIQSFKHMPDAKLVPPLIDILKLDVDSFPIALHAYACEVLGEIALSDPAAIDDAAAKQITLTIFFSNNKNQNVDRECGLAVQALGKKAEGELIKIFKGERDDVQKLMMKYDTPNAPFPQNHPKLIASKRLASLRSAPGATVMIADLDSVKAAPKELRGNSAVSWRVKEGQSASETIYALGDIGDPAAIEVLHKILLNDIQKQWDDITDGMVELQLRQDSASALNRIGDRKALDALYKMAKEGVVIDFEKRAAMLEGRGQAVKEVERYQFNWIVAQEFANLATGDRLESFRELVESTSKKYPDLGKKLATFIPMIELAKECEAKGDAKAQAACYGAKLSDPKPDIRAKAAWELTRLPAEASSAVIIANLGTDFLDTREILTAGLHRMPSKEALAKVEEIMKKESNKNAAAYRLDRFRLALLRANLTNSVR